ncbi:TPA: hypothetical protein ACH3X2_003701 [Trebouxia sp. C0005]
MGGVLVMFAIVFVTSVVNMCSVRDCVLPKAFCTNYCQTSYHHSDAQSQHRSTATSLSSNSFIILHAFRSMVTEPLNTSHHLLLLGHTIKSRYIFLHNLYHSCGCMFEPRKESLGAKLFVRCHAKA